MENIGNDTAVRPEPSEMLTFLLDSVAAAALECGHADSPDLIAENEHVRTQFIAFRDELKIAGASEIALMEFRMRNRQVVNLLAEPDEAKVADLWRRIA